MASRKPSKVKPGTQRRRALTSKLQPTELRLPALEVRQSARRVLYSFAVDGKLIRSFAAVSRIRRVGERRLAGYQRPEVLSHISQIRRYLESGDAMLPNAVVLAFNQTVRFVPAPGRSVGNARHGTLLIPVDPTWNEDSKPAWIVDGQQRLAAIDDALIDAFPICAVGFVATSDSDQREQFMLVNSTKPLPKSLIYELLPVVDTRLPAALQARKLPAQIVEELNYAVDSPFRGLIKTATNPDGIVKDNSILKMVENSLSDGILYWFIGAARNELDMKRIMRVLFDYWGAVAEVFGDAAWGISPRRSRLMHGVGIVSMGMLMDTICAAYRTQPPTREEFRKELAAVAPACHWTSGYWQFSNGDRRKWNELQNTSREIQLLSDHLREEYKARVWKAARAV